MDKKNNAQYTIDELALQAGGYFSMPTQEDIAYTDLLFDVCQQFGIRYYSASAKEKAFVEEVTRVTYSFFRRLEIRVQRQLCKFRITDILQLLQRGIRHRQQLRLICTDVTAHFAQLPHQALARTGVVNAHQVHFIVCKIHIIAPFLRSAWARVFPFCLLSPLALLAWLEWMTVLPALRRSVSDRC